MNKTAETSAVDTNIERAAYAELASLIRDRGEREFPACICYEKAAAMVDEFAAEHPPRGDRSVCQSCGEWFRYVPSVESSVHCFACFSQNKDAERTTLRQQCEEAERKHAAAEGECEELRADIASLDHYKRVADDRGRTIEILAEALRRYRSDENWLAQKKIAHDALIAAGIEEST